jgi:hypothetical protein
MLFPPQLTSQDKTPAVISRAVAKHNLESEPGEGYELVQVISDERGTTFSLTLFLAFELR